MHKKIVVTWNSILTAALIGAAIGFGQVQDKQTDVINQHTAMIAEHREIINLQTEAINLQTEAILRLVELTKPS